MQYQEEKDARKRKVKNGRHSKRRGAVSMQRTPGRSSISSPPPIKSLRRRPKKKKEKKIGALKLLVLPSPLRKKNNMRGSKSSPAVSADSIATTITSTTNTTTNSTPLLPGDDPFALLHEKMKESNHGYADRIIILQKNIMEQKIKLNKLIVDRTRLAKKHQTAEDRLRQCRETVKATDRTVSKLSAMSNAKESSGSATIALGNVLAEHRKGLFLQQIVTLCGECTGKSTQIEQESGDAIMVLDEQMTRLRLQLKQITHDNKQKFTVVIPTSEKSLERYKKLSKLTLSELERGVDRLEDGERERVAESQRTKSVQKSVHRKANAARAVSNMKATGASLMKTLGLKITKNEFKVNVFCLLFLVSP
jgi:hypothetical protein